MNLHHTQDPVCPLCEQKKTELDPLLIPWWDFVKSNNPDCHMSWGFRDKENQNLFYQMGKTKCVWPNSKHNTMVGDVPCSQAFDVFQLMTNGIANFSAAFCSQIAQQLKDANAPVQWSGEWVSFKEKDHFQLIKS